MSSLDLLLAMYSAKHYGFSLRMNIARTTLDKDCLGYLMCWLKKLHPRSLINVAILSFLSVREIRCVHKEQTDAKGGSDYLPETTEGAYFSYHLFFWVIIWSQISLLHLGRSWQTSNSETPSACSMKTGCVLSAGGVFREGGGGKCKQHAFPQPLSQLPQLPSSHYSFKPLGPLSSAYLSAA